MTNQCKQSCVPRFLHDNISFFVHSADFLRLKDPSPPAKLRAWIGFTWM